MRNRAYLRHGQVVFEGDPAALDQSPMVRAFVSQLERDMASALYGLPVITSKYIPTDSMLIMGNKLITGEAMSTKTGSIHVNVYDGPHHGRILIIPSDSSRHVVLPNPMPPGAMWGAGRSNPSAYKHLREVTYELRTSKDGVKYLGYVEGKRNNFVIPVEPSIKVSVTGLDLVRKLRDEGFNYGIGSNGTVAERYALMQRAEKAVVEYISKLERESYPGVHQNATVRY